MNNVIVYGPQGCGKTRYGEALRVHYGMRRVVDGNDFFDDSTRALNGNLILVTANEVLPFWSYAGRVINYFDAVKAAGLV